MRIESGATDRELAFVAVDATDLKTRETGLSSFTVYRQRNGGTPAAMTTPTISESSAANMPGVYTLLVDEDTTIGAGHDEEQMVFHITHAGMAPVTITAELYRPKITAGNTLGVESDGDLTKVNVLDGHTAQTGDNFARLGAPAGVSVSADIAAVKGDTDNIKGRLPAALVGGRMSSDVGSVSGDAAAADNLEADYDGTGYDKAASTIGTCTANTDMRGTDNAALAAVCTEARLAELDAGNIPNDTGTVIPGLIAALNDIDAATVKAQADQALADVNLDHVVGTATGIPAVPAGTFLDQIMRDGTEAYDRNTDSLQAIRDRGDAAWTTGAGGSDRLLMVDTTIATLASQTSFTLAAGSADDDAYNNCTIVIEDATTATQKVMGIVSAYAGATRTVTLKYDPAVFTMAVGDKVYILAENALKATEANRQLDVAADGKLVEVSTLSGHTPQTGDNFAVLGTPAGSSVSDDIAAIKAETALIVADTNELQTDWTDGGRLDLILDARASQATVDVIDGKADAILVDTGTTIPGLIVGLNNISPAEVNAEMVDVLRVDTMTLPGQEAPPATPTMTVALAWVYKALRNRKSQDGSLWLLYADDGTTVDAKAGVSDDTTTAVKEEIVSGP